VYFGRQEVSEHPAVSTLQIEKFGERGGVLENVETYVPNLTASHRINTIITIIIIII
jgi:hypothetical protein